MEITVLFVRYTDLKREEMDGFHELTFRYRTVSFMREQGEHYPRFLTQMHMKLML